MPGVILHTRHALEKKLHDTGSVYHVIKPLKKKNHDECDSAVMVQTSCSFCHHSCQHHPSQDAAVAADGAEICVDLP